VIYLLSPAWRPLYSCPSLSSCWWISALSTRKSRKSLITRLSRWTSLSQSCSCCIFEGSTRVKRFPWFEICSQSCYYLWSFPPVSVTSRMLPNPPALKYLWQYYQTLRLRSIPSVTSTRPALSWAWRYRYWTDRSSLICSFSYFLRLSWSS
jgi:hypothetical protein